MDWNTAKNFCHANGMHLVSLTESLCAKTGETWTCDWATLKKEGSKLKTALWLTSNPDTENSCKAYGVAAGSSKVVSYSRNGNFYAAVCK